MYSSIHVKCPELANPQKQKGDQRLPGAEQKGGRGVTVNEHAVSFWAVKVETNITTWTSEYWGLESHQYKGDLSFLSYRAMSKTERVSSVNTKLPLQDQPH